jgi:hypothetical protein
MPTLTDAEAALDAAHDAKESTHAALQKATDDAADLRAKVKGGGRAAAKISPADISAADAAVEHASLAYHGAVAAIPDLAAAVKQARADEACDEVLAALPALGQNVLSALQTIEALLPQLVAAAEQYDSFIEASVHRLQKVVPSEEPSWQFADPPPRRGGTAASPFVPGAAEAASSEPGPAPTPQRAKFPRHGAPTLDGIPLASCRAPSQLAKILLPAMRELGGQGGGSLIETLKLLAAGAPALPTP